MKNKRKKFIVVASFLALIAIVIGLLPLILPIRKGIWLDDHFFAQSGNKLIYNSDNYIEEVKKNEFRLVDGGVIKKAKIQVDGKNVKTTFSNDTVIETKVEDGQVTMKGDSVETYSSVEYENGEHAIPSEDYAYALTKFHFQIFENFKMKSFHWWMVVIGMLIYVISVFQILYPNDFYFLFKKWMFEEPKLSEEGELIYRIGAGCIAIIGWVFATGLLDKWIIQ